MRALGTVILFLLAQLGHAQMWTNIGPTPISDRRNPANPSNFNSGRVASIAVDPSDLNHWLIGTGNGGVWESRDGGVSWVPLTDGMPTLAIGAVAFALSNPNVIYAATGEATQSGFTKAGMGVLKSTDGGRSWNLLAASSFARASVRRVRVHPTNLDVVEAITSRGGFGRDSQEAAPSPPPFGVLKSIDGGGTWTRTLAGQATALEIDPTNFNNQYAAIGDVRTGVFNDSPGSALNGLYRSVDGGQTWVAIAGPWGASTASHAATGRIELAIAPSNMNVLYASIAGAPNGGSSGQPLLGLYRTSNAWAATPTWVQIPTAATGDTGYCGPTKCNYSHVISVDPSDENTLFAGGGERTELWQCSSCGATPAWTNTAANSSVHPDFHAMAWAAKRLIVGNDGGVWSLPERGGTWVSHNATISTAVFFSAALHPTDPDFIVGRVAGFFRCPTPRKLLVESSGTPDGCRRRAHHRRRRMG